MHEPMLIGNERYLRTTSGNPPAHPLGIIGVQPTRLVLHCTTPYREYELHYQDWHHTYA